MAHDQQLKRDGYNRMDTPADYGTIGYIHLGVIGGIYSYKADIYKHARMLQYSGFNVKVQHKAFYYMLWVKKGR